MAELTTMILNNFKTRFEIAKYIYCMDDIRIDKLLSYYEVLVGHYHLSSNNSDFIMKHKEVYSVILDYNVSLMVTILITEKSCKLRKTIMNYNTSSNNKKQALYKAIIQGELYQFLHDAVGKDFTVTYKGATVDELDQMLNKPPINITDDQMNYGVDTTLTSSQISNDTTDKIEEIKKIWGKRIKPTIDDIMVSFKVLYSSGYGLLSPVGIMTDIGVVASRASDGKLITRGHDDDTGDIATDVELYHAVRKASGDKFELFSNSLEDEEYSKYKDSDTPVTLTYFHIRNTFGHIKFCTHKHSLAHYLTTHNIKNNGSKVKTWDEMSGYVREEVENIFYSAYLEEGMPTSPREINDAVINKAKEIEVKITASLKNVIVVAERKNDVNIRIRICSNAPLINIESNISSILNNGTTRPVKVKLINEVSGVYDINIIYNEKAYFQDALFAYQVVDKLLEQGTNPAWDNVILGKDLDGNIFTYNFKDPNNSTVALYGAKGSGKGVMTLNLVASALADGCDLIYIDGKPDTSKCLVETTWKNGLDACVFNGKEVKGSPLETEACNGIREVSSRFMSKQHIPKNIFDTSDDMEEFILLTTYYRGLELTLRMAEERAAKVLNKSHNEKWLVAIFDECQQVAEAETKVIAILDKAQAERKKAEEEYTDSKGNTKTRKINYMHDEAWLFIEEYTKWRRIIQSKMATALGSTFRKAEITVVYIWQTTDFPDKYANDSIIAAAIKQDGGSIVKIVGRGALVRGGSTTFGTPNSVSTDASWYDEKFSGKNGGYWAIGNNVNKDEVMQVFRPFNVYSDAKDKDLLVQNAVAAGLSERDLIGISLDQNGNPIPEIGFEGYTNKLLDPMGLSTAKQLNLGFIHAEEFIKRMGYANSLLEFMYNAHSFGIAGTEGSDTGNISKGFLPTDFVTSESGVGLDDNTGINNVGDQNRIAAVSTPTKIQETSFQNMSSLASQRANEAKIHQIEHQRNQIYASIQNVSIDDEDDEIILDVNSSVQSPVMPTGQTHSPSQEPLHQQQTSNNNVVNLNGGQNVSANIQPPVIDKQSIRNLSIPQTQIGESVFSQGADGAISLNSNRTNAIKYVVTPDNTISVSYSRPKGVRKFVLDTVRGVEKEFKNRWDLVIRAIKTNISDLTLITDVQIYDTIFKIGKKHVDVSDVLYSEDTDLTLDALIHFGSLAAILPNVKALIIDSTIYGAAEGEFKASGLSGAMGLFATFKKLNILRIVDVTNFDATDSRSSLENIAEFTRSMFESEQQTLAQQHIDAKNAKKEAIKAQHALTRAEHKVEKANSNSERDKAMRTVEKLRQEQKLKAQIAAMAAMKSSHGANKSPIEKAVLNKRLLDASGNAFGNAWDALMNINRHPVRSVIGWTGYSIMGIFTGMGGILTSLFKKR